MPSLATLRTLVQAHILYQVFSVLYGASVPQSPDRSKDSTEDLVIQADYPLLDNAILAFGLLLYLMHIAASIGISRLWWPARPLFLGTTAIMSVSMIFMDLPAIPSWLAACDYVFAINTGLILALIYWSPLHQLYTKSPPLTDAHRHGSS